MSAELAQQIEQTFSFHPGNADVAVRYSELRIKFKDLAHFINNVCPDGRIKSIAITKLEEVQMRAIQSIAIEQPTGPETQRKLPFDEMSGEFKTAFLGKAPETIRPFLNNED